MWPWPTWGCDNTMACSRQSSSSEATRNHNGQAISEEYDLLQRFPTHREPWVFSLHSSDVRYKANLLSSRGLHHKSFVGCSGCVSPCWQKTSNHQGWKTAMGKAMEQENKAVHCLSNQGAQDLLLHTKAHLWGLQNACWNTSASVAACLHGRGWPQKNSSNHRNETISANLRTSWRTPEQV